MSSSRPVFRSRWLPYLLVAPQLIITVIFFIWPAGEALWYSLQSVDPFGFSSQFVGLDNFVTLFHDSYYLDSFWTTIKFSTFVTVSGLLVSLFFAALVEYIVRGSRFYQTLMLLPYAVAPAVAAVLWIFLFNPGRGLITHFLAEFGYDWNHAQNSGQAMFLVVFASVWKQISYNFLFFYAALQSIPTNLLVAQHQQLKTGLFSGLLKTPSFRRAQSEALDRAATWLERIGLLEHANRQASNLAYGDQRRLEIARCMVTQPEILMLDEPAAGLNPKETKELDELIAELRNHHNTTILLIEHDMKLVMGISDRIYVVNQGTPLANGTPEQIRNNPDVIRAYLGEA